MSATAPAALPSENAISCMLPTIHIKAMVKALKSTGLFTIKSDSETVSAFHTSTNREVFAALHKGNGHWIIRHHKQLFA